MASTSVSDFVSLINQQLNSREELNTYLSKVKALINVIIDSNLLDLPETTLYEYLCALSDFTNEAININEGALGLLLELSKSEI